MDRNVVTVSKFLAKHLRHAPDALGLTLQPGGSLAVDELLAASARAGFTITYDELLECVETNDKQRFSFEVTVHPSSANVHHEKRPFFIYQISSNTIGKPFSPIYSLSDLF